MTGGLTFPAFDPVAFEIGPLAVRWYALAYVVSLVLGWLYMRHLAAREPRFMSREAVDDFLLWATLAILIGGRLGYVVFYRPSHYLANPLEALYLWRGGMSFHGGLAGMIVALLVFARRRSLPILGLSDIIAPAVPIGLFFGRIANFVNGELYGRPAEVPWAMRFPGGGPLPRHPSQLYEAALEGLALFGLLLVLDRVVRVRARPGLLTGAFLAGYAAARMIVELYREPDTHLGFLFAGITMGQTLSLPMLVAGLGLLAWAARRPRS